MSQHHFMPCAPYLWYYGTSTLSQHQFMPCAPYLWYYGTLSQHQFIPYAPYLWYYGTLSQHQFMPCVPYLWYHGTLSQHQFIPYAPFLWCHWSLSHNLSSVPPWYVIFGAFFARLLPCTIAATFLTFSTKCFHQRHFTCFLLSSKCRDGHLRKK